MNKVYLVGKSMGNLKFNHTFVKKGQNIQVYEVQFLTKSKCGLENKIRVLIEETHPSFNCFKNTDKKLELKGRYKSFNKEESGRRVCELYLKLEHVSCCNEERDINKIKMHGDVSGHLITKKTKNNELIVETKIRVKRDTGVRKYDYIPVVAFGKVAERLLEKKPYDALFISGRIHSREYMKNGEERIAYEVAIHNLKCVKE